MKLEIGKRYLLNKISTLRSQKTLLRPEEHFILEISSTGKFFKSRTKDSLFGWESIDNYTILEELPKEIS